MKAPHGLDEIMKVFGDPRPFVNEDGTISPRWEAQALVMVTLPFALTFDAGLKKAPVPITRLRCHRLLATEMVLCFDELLRRGLNSSVREFGGCYAWRRQRGGARLSTHAWGIAIDLNPSADPLGDTAIDMDRRVVEVFESRGWTWGGRWERPDAMHFQFASGY